MNCVVFWKLVICAKTECVNDNDAVNDGNAASVSHEQDICGITSYDVVIFSH